MREYIRVRDYRERQIAKMPNVEVFRESLLTADDVLRLRGRPCRDRHRRPLAADLLRRQAFVPIADDGTAVFTPDDIMDGRLPAGPTVVYDGDGYYMGSVIAERLRAAGLEVTLVTPHDSVSPWAENTGEGWRMPEHLMGLGITLVTAQELSWFDGKALTLSCAHSARKTPLPAANLVVVGQRAPVDELYTALRYTPDGSHADLPFTLTRIGDCEAPAIIAAATYAGHRYAQELDKSVDIDLPMPHDKVDVGLVPPSHLQQAAE